MTTPEDSDADAWRPFAVAYARFEGSRDWHPDLAEFHRRRFEAYVDLLGTKLPNLVEDKTSENTTAEQWKEDLLFKQGFHRLGVKYETFESPFAGILVAPKPLSSVIRMYDPQFLELVARQKELIIDAMVVFAQAIWGTPRRTVTDADLVPYGADAGQEPDDYFYM